MQIIADHYQTGGASRPSLTCPNCRKVGVFELVNNVLDVQVTHPSRYALGIKHCPNKACNAMVYLIMDLNSSVLQSFPAERIDFDTSNVPTAIVACLDEALTCHAHACHAACAIMVRRTLELLCDAKSAVGKDLRERIANLKSKVVLPNELFVAMDELRLLGNDAAHVEAKTYADVSSEETATAIELTKEILKAVYQLDDLVKRLQALKKK